MKNKLFSLCVCVRIAMETNVGSSFGIWWEFVSKHACSSDNN